MHFILERGTQFVVSLRDRRRDIYLERGLLLGPYLLSGARGCQHLHLVASRIIRDDLTTLIGCVSLVRLSILNGLCLNLTTWFSFHVVSFRLHTCSTGLPRRTAIPLFSNHNVIPCQTHGVTRNELKIHVNRHYIIWGLIRVLYLFKNCLKKVMWPKRRKR